MERSEEKEKKITKRREMRRNDIKRRKKEEMRKREGKSGAREEAKGYKEERKEKRGVRDSLKQLAEEREKMVRMGFAKERGETRGEERRVELGKAFFDEAITKEVFLVG